MKRSLLVLVLALVACSSAQENSDDSSAPRKLSLKCPDGVMTRVDSKGQPAEVGKVDVKDCSASAKLDDRGMNKLKRIGTWTVFADGKKARTEEYVAGLKEGAETGYYPDGSIRYTGQNSADKKNGHWKISAGPGSTCYSEGDYAQDQKNGPWVDCDKGEKGYYKSFEGAYVSGLRDGPTVFLYEDGKKVGEGSYRADVACAKALRPGYKQADFDACGKRIGHWVYYFPNGQKSSEGDCDPATGLETGTWHDFYMSGEKLGMGPRSGDRTGLWTFWEKSGAILMQLEFKGNDFLPQAGVVWKDGKKTAQGTFSMGMSSFDAKADQMKITSLIKDGPWIEYYPNGQKSGEGRYTSNRRDGKWTFYEK